MFGDMANKIWSDSTQYSANVVDKSHRRAAQRRGKEFAGDHAEAAKVAGSEKADEWSNEQQSVRIAHVREQRHQQRGNKQIADICVLAAEAVGKISKDDVAQKCAHLHDDRPCGSLNNAQA